MATACIHRRMSGNVRRIVRQRPQRKGILVDILTLEQQLPNKISTANIVHQVAKLPTPKRIVTEVLDYGTAVGVGMGLAELVGGESPGKRWSRRGWISSVQTRSTISSWVRTE